MALIVIVQLQIWGAAFYQIGSLESESKRWNDDVHGIDR